MLRTPCFWNSMWWWPITKNKSLQKSVFKQARWSTSLKRVRVVSNQNRCTTVLSKKKQHACYVYVKHKHSVFSHIVPRTLCPFLYLNSFTFFVRSLLAVAQPPSGGSLWPAVSPVFSHCWFRLRARMLPLARGMSSRLILIIPPHFNGKPARHAGFTNASCRESLVSCLTSWKS